MSFEELLPFIIFAFYLIIPLLTKRKKDREKARKASESTVLTEQPASKESPFESILSEIKRAFEEQPTPQPVVQEKPTSTTTKPTFADATSDAFEWHADKRTFQDGSSSSFVHNREFSKEESFEDHDFFKQGDTFSGKHPNNKIAQVSVGNVPHPILEKLKNKEAIQEAFVLHEILSPPKSNKFLSK